MKICFTLLILLALNINTAAQQYIPMPTSDATWVYTHNRKGSIYDLSILRFMLTINGEDTVMNGLTYKKIMYRAYDTIYYYRYSISKPFNRTVANSLDSYYGGIREENKRVYLKLLLAPGNSLASDTNEKLYFDFNLNVGDTAPGGYLIKRIDSILVHNTFRKRYVTTFKFDGDTLSYIEGVGYHEGLIFAPQYTQFYRAFLHCFTHKSNTYTKRDSCFYIWPMGTVLDTSENEPPLDTNEVHIYPNPFHNVLTIETQDTVSVLLYNSMAKLVLRAENITGKVNLNTSALYSGMYWLLYTDKNGGRRTQKLFRE